MPPRPKPYEGALRMTNTDDSILPAYTGDGATCTGCGGHVTYSRDFACFLHDGPLPYDCDEGHAIKKAARNVVEYRKTR